MNHGAAVGREESTNGEVGGKLHSIGQGLFRFRPDGSALEFLQGTTHDIWGLGFTEQFDVVGPGFRRARPRRCGMDRRCPVLRAPDLNQRRRTGDVGGSCQGPHRTEAAHRQPFCNPRFDCRRALPEQAGHKNLAPSPFRSFASSAMSAGSLNPARASPASLDPISVGVHAPRGWMGF